MPDVGAEQRPLRDGRYRLLKPLGEGGMAVVWLAHDERLGVSRAVKVLNANLSSKGSVRRRFEAEARTMARLHHRHIVTVHDVDSDGDVTFIVMELVDGGSVWDRVRSAGPLPPRIVCEVTADLLAALQVAHEAGVIHRDVKPHNALIARDGTIKLSDFGIAQVQGDASATRTGSIMGTLAYMAPEQRSDAKHVGPTADLYAVGGTIYAIATGRDPLDLHSDQARAEQLDALPEPLRAIVDRACRYKPDERWQSAAEMRAAVLEAVTLLPETPLGTPPLVSPPPAQAPATGAGVTLDVSRLDAAPQNSTLGEVHLPPSVPTRVGTVASIPTMATVDRRPLWLGGALALVAALAVTTAGAGWTIANLVGTDAIEPTVEDPPARPEPARPLDVREPPPAPTPRPDTEAPAAKPRPTRPVTPRPTAVQAPSPIPTVEPPPILTPTAQSPAEPAAPTARLYVNAKPRSVVTIDGAASGLTPVTVQITPGAHVVSVQLEGKEPVTRTIDVGTAAGGAFCWDFNAGAVCTR